MKKRIYILRQCMADNIQHLATMRVRDHHKLKPVTVIDFPDGEREPIACHEVQVHGSCKLRYKPDAPKAKPGHPLDLIAKGITPEGTKVWLETENAVTVTTWGQLSELIE